VRVHVVLTASTANFLYLRAASELLFCEIVERINCDLSTLRVSMITARMAAADGLDLV